MHRSLARAPQDCAAWRPRDLRPNLTFAATQANGIVWRPFLT